jgi:hypothetical protein
MTPEFRSAYGDLVNAQSRMRTGVQGEVERTTGMFGMPTRTEVNSSHKKVTQLERDLRELKERLAVLEAAANVKASAPPKAAASKPVPAASKPAAKPTKPTPATRRAKK